MNASQSLGVIDIQLPQYVDNRGELTFAEGQTAIPFDIARVFWICNVPPGQRRGGHAHWHCHEALFAVSGSFRILVDDGHEERNVLLDSPTHGIVIPAGAWCELEDFSSDALCLVLASEHYDATGYCHDKREWRKMLGIGTNDTND